MNKELNKFFETIIIPLWFIRDYSEPNHCILKPDSKDDILTFENEDEAYKYTLKHKLDPIRFKVQRLR